MAKAAKVSRKEQENRVVRYIKATRSELRKVVWPTRDETVNLTIIVLIVTIGMSVFLGILDFLFAQAFELIIR
ncbi:MAG: preprotein translocase subunit SecE [Anaerolineae bacterium]